VQGFRAVSWQGARVRVGHGQGPMPVKVGVGGTHIQKHAHTPTLQAAQRFAHLAPSLAAATAAYSQRQQAAEAALDAAVASSPMQVCGLDQLNTLDTLRGCLLPEKRLTLHATLLSSSSCT